MAKHFQNIAKVVKFCLIWSHWTSDKMGRSWLQLHSCDTALCTTATVCYIVEHDTSQLPNSQINLVIVLYALSPFLAFHKTQQCLSYKPSSHPTKELHA